MGMDYVNNRVDYISGLSLPKCAMRFNGVIFENEVPGYRTNSVTGRESLASDIKELSTEIKDGSVFVKSRKLTRDIVVNFSISTGSPEDYQQACNTLKGLIRSYDTYLEEKTYEVVFMDEDDKCFYGVITDFTIDKIDELFNGTGSGSITIHCSDPFKYSLAWEEVDPSTEEGFEDTFLFDYDGTYFSRPVFETVPTYEMGYIAFLSGDEKIIQIGDPDEADWVWQATNKSEKLIDEQFHDYPAGTGGLSKFAKNVTSGWWGDVNAQTPSNASLTIKQDSNDYYKTNTSGTKDYRRSLELSSAGTKPSNGTWHGPAISLNIPTDSQGGEGAKNFRYYFNLNWCPGDINYCYWLAFSVDYVSDGTVTGQTTKSVAVLSFVKRSAGNNNIEVRYESNGKVLYTTTDKVTLTKNKYLADAFVNNMIQNAYIEALNRVPSATEKTYWRNKIKNENLSWGNFYKNVFMSKEYTNKKTSNSQFVEHLYLVYLRRASDAGGKQHWLNHLAKNSRSTVCDGFAKSDEFNKMLDRELNRTNRSCSITKSGKTITFDNGAIKKTFTVDALANVKATRINIWQGTATKKPKNDGVPVWSMSFYKDKVDQWKDVPNKLRSNKAITADCRTGDIIVDGRINHGLGAIGNDWETFLIRPGMNQIKFIYSDWATKPNVKLKYQKVYL